MISVVVPTIGRPSLGVLLDALAAGTGDPPDELILVDDRRDRSAALVEVPAALKPVTRVVAGPARGPAAARNAGWRACSGAWVAFLDDDVVPSATWPRDLRADLAGADLAGADLAGSDLAGSDLAGSDLAGSDLAGSDLAGSDLAGAAAPVVGVQGRIEVPLPAGRRPTDWERVTAGLAAGRWITADLAYRRAALAAVGGFDERFPRAFREDADLAARLRAAGGTLVVGGRRVTHPVRPVGPWISLRTQAGNADDALLRRRYGPAWRSRLEIPPGRRRRHALVVAAGLVGLGAVPLLRRSPPARVVATAAGLAWLAGTAEFAARRIAPGPRTPREVAVMAATSVAIPPLALAHWLRGWWRWRHTPPFPGDTSDV